MNIKQFQELQKNMKQYDAGMRLRFRRLANKIQQIHNRIKVIEEVLLEEIKERDIGLSE